MSARIVNLADLEYRPWTHGERYDAKMGEIGGRVGSVKLGYNLTVIAPGKASFPFHNHRVNEEMFLVLEGEGELRLGAERHRLRGGDVIACLAGGPELAHQITNTSATAEFRMLAVSTMQYPEIVQYPDSGKVGVRGQFQDAEGKEEVMRFVFRPGVGFADYWDGE